MSEENKNIEGEKSAVDNQQYGIDTRYIRAAGLAVELITDLKKEYHLE